ncbi:MAG TPA: DUF4838 domain-containing protein [Chthoniobacteraceae bacterium]|nr:DUF4838 domain-containing protein [Chthoniobacteraceae bacterium]
MKIHQILVIALALQAAPVWSEESAPANSPEKTLVLVEDGRARAAIVTGPQPGEAVGSAARTLQEYLTKSTGVEVPIQEGPGTGISIHIGLTPRVRESDIAARVKELDSDGFILESPDSRNVMIVGSSDRGTGFGVHAFLERYLGVRWLMPGSFGEDVPRHATLAIPIESLREEPAFLSRDFTKSSALDGLWAARNRLHRRVSSGHNMLRLFPVAEYGTTRPDFYPLIDGKRLIPPRRISKPRTTREKRAHYHWQPNFTAPGIADAAAETIIRHFQEHPEAESFELGLNDGNDLFDQSEASLKRRSGKKNSMGYLDASDDYFLWANEVAEKVLKERPGKWFSTLAYRAITDPPSYAGVHERIVPYMTLDRLRWADPELREIDKERTLKWAKTVRNIGWYDYSYGMSYFVPRIYPHVMGEYLKWAADHHVRFYTGEQNPNWGEGPKAWLLARLLWNPRQEVDPLLDEWYDRAAGPGAAPKLKGYYDLWERFWTHDILQTRWWHGRSPYLTFANRAYLLDVPREYVTRSDRLLAEALALADTPQRKERVAHLKEMWDTWYKPHLVLYRAQETGGAPPETEEEAFKALQAAEEIMIVAKEFKRTCVLWEKDERYRADPFFGHIGARFKTRRPAPPDYGDGSHLLWRLEPWIARSNRIKDRLEQIAADGEPAVRETAAALLAAAEGAGVPVLKNPSFEVGTQGWSLEVETTPFPNDYPFEDAAGGGRGTFLISDARAKEGTSSLMISADRLPGTPTIRTPAHLSQEIPYQPGRYYASLHSYLPRGAPQTRGVVRLAVLDAEGNELKKSLPSVKLATRPGRWARSATAFTLPPDDKAKTVRIVVDLTMLTPLGDFDPKQKIFIDEVSVVRLP